MNLEASHVAMTRDGNLFPYSVLKFNGGEIHVRLAPVNIPGEVTIRASLDSSDALMELILLTDALRRARSRYGHLDIHLVAPYLPYARQDRVANAGEAHSLRVLCDLINAQNYASVEVWDVHSDVALGTLNRVRHKSLIDIHLQRGSRFFGSVLVAPDVGAFKKVFGLARALELKMVQANKVRDTKTGAITDTVVYSGHIGDQSFLIVDDICDGGRTFLDLAQKLRPLTNGTVDLYVTHGIFSQGLDVFDGIINRIYVANLFRGVNTTRHIIQI